MAPAERCKLGANVGKTGCNRPAFWKMTASPPPVFNPLCKRCVKLKKLSFIYRSILGEPWLAYDEVLNSTAADYSSPTRFCA